MRPDRIKAIELDRVAKVITMSDNSVHDGPPPILPPVPEGIWSFSEDQPTATPEQSHLTPSGALQTFPHLHPEHDGSSDNSSQQNYVPHTPSPSPTLANDEDSLSRSTSGTTLVNSTNHSTDLKPQSDVKEKSHEVRDSLDLQQMGGNEQLIAHIHAIFEGENKEAKILELVTHLFAGDKDKQAESNLTETSIREHKQAVSNLTKDLIFVLSADEAKLDINNAKPDWLLPGAIHTAIVLSQVCQNNVQEALQVLDSMNEPLDISGKKRISGNKEIKEKAWRCMQQLATAEGYAQAAVLKLQGITPNPAQPDEYSKEVVLIRYLQAWRKLRSFIPSLEAIPYYDIEQVNSIGELPNLDAKQALMVINTSHKIMRGEHLSGLTREEIAGYWGWGKGIRDISTRNAFINRSYKLHTAALKDRKKYGSRLSGAKRLRHTILRTLGIGKAPAPPKDSELLKKDYPKDPSKSEEYNEAINDPANMLCEDLEKHMLNLGGNSALRAEAAIDLASLELWLRMANNKGLGQPFKVNKAFAKEFFNSQESRLLNDPKLNDPEAAKIFAKEKSKAIRKLTEASLLSRLVTASTNQIPHIPFLANLVSKKLDEELFSITGLEKRAQKLREDHEELLKNSEELREANERLHIDSDSFTQSIQTARDLSFSLQKKSDADNIQKLDTADIHGPNAGEIREIQEAIQEIQERKEFAERVVTGASGNAYFVFDGGVFGYTASFIHKIANLTLSFLPISIILDTGYIRSRQASYDVRRDPDYGAQLTFSTTTEHYPRFGGGVLLGYEKVIEKFRFFAGASVTVSPRIKITNVEEAGLRVGHDNSPEANAELVQIYFDAILKTMRKWLAIRKNPEHPEHQSNFDTWSTQCLFEELAAAANNKKLSVFFNQHEKVQPEIMLVGRGGVQAGSDSPSIPSARIGAGENYKKGIILRDVTSSKLGDQPEIARRLGREIKRDRVVGISGPMTAPSEPLATRIPINLTTGRTVFKEKQEIDQISRMPNPENRFLENVFFKETNITRDPTIPDAKLVSSKMHRMDETSTLIYNTLHGAAKLYNAAHEERQWLQQTSTKDTGIIEDQISTLSRSTEKLANNEDAWQSLGDSLHHQIERNKPSILSGLSWMIKAKIIEGESLSFGRQFTPASESTKSENPAELYKASDEENLANKVEVRQLSDEGSERNTTGREMTETESTRSEPNKLRRRPKLKFKFRR